MKKGFLSLAFCFLAFTIVACESNEEDMIAQAQACLDSIDPNISDRSTMQSLAATCEAKVAGISSQRASVIKCSAKFIAEGFTATRFANAFTVLKNKPSGVNSTVAMTAYLAFEGDGTTAASANTAASTAKSVCAETGLAGMIAFADLSVVATQIATSLGGAVDVDTLTPSDMQTLVSNLDGAELETIGEAAISISQVYCTNASTEGAEFCTQINQAVAAGSSAADIGQQLKTLLQNTSN